MRLVNECVRPFVRPVGLSNTLETKFGWLAFPGLIRGITIIHVFMYLLLLFQPESIKVFVFDWDLILKGEVWRLVSFFLLPKILGTSAFSVLFMFIAMMIAFMINDALEHAWGVFRTSLYCYGLLICHTLALTLLSVSNSGVDVPNASREGGLIFYGAIFLAFASTFPRHEFRLFFILPVQVWTIAVVIGIFIVLGSFSSKWAAIYIYLCFLPYLVWALPRFLRWNRERGRTAARRAKYRAHGLPEGESFHACAECGATDDTHPDRDFFVTEDDRELCNACLEGASKEDEAAKSAP